MALGQRTGRKRHVVAWRALAPAVTSAVQPESFQQRGFLNFQVTVQNHLERTGPWAALQLSR